MKKQLSPAVAAIVIIVVVIVVAVLIWQFAGQNSTPKGGGEAAKFMKGAGMGAGKAGAQPGQPGPGGPIAAESKGEGKGMAGQIMKQRPMGGGG